MLRIVNIVIVFMFCFMNVCAGNYVVQQDGSIRFAWQKYEECWIFAIPQNPIAIYVSNPSSNIATLNTNGWSLVPNTKYYSFYPFLNSPNSFDRPTVSYLSQIQKQNYSSEHLSKYDYMTAQTTSTSNACHLDYNHLGSILKFECALPETKILNALVLSSENDVFTETAIMNVTEETLNPLTRSSSATLQLNNISVDSGGKLVAYMMIPATDFTDVTITTALVADDGTTSEMKIKGTNVLAGHVYPIVLEMPGFKVPKAKKIGHSEDENASPAKQNMDTKTVSAVSIQQPTATVPDFLIDLEHSFELLTPSPEIDIATSIDNINDSHSEKIYTISGIAASPLRKGNVCISNGKKYIK